MNDVDARLTAALEADAPPERDPVFRLDVLARIARSRLRRQMTRTTVVALAAAVMVGINAEALDAWLATDPRHPWIAAVAASGGLLAIAGTLIAALPGMRSLTRMFGRWFSG